MTGDRQDVDSDPLWDATTAQREAVARLLVERDCELDHIGTRMDDRDVDDDDAFDEDGILLPDAPLPRTVFLFWLPDGAKGEIAAEGDVWFGRPGGRTIRGSGADDGE